MTRSEEILRDGLEDAISAFGLLEATLRAFRDAPTADVVRDMKNKASRSLARAAALSQPNQEDTK